MAANSDIIKQQFKWLPKLQAITKRPILIKAVEGATPKGDDYNLYRWLPFYDIKHLVIENNEPIYTRAILKNEILIDPDTYKKYMYHPDSGYIWELVSNSDIPEPDLDKLIRIVRYYQDEIVPSKD